MTAPLLTLCGRMNGAAVLVHMAAGESMYTLSVNGPEGADIGVAVKTAVCQAASEKLSSTQSLDVAIVWQS